MFLKFTEGIRHKHKRKSRKQRALKFAFEVFRYKVLMNCENTSAGKNVSVPVAFLIGFNFFQRELVYVLIRNGDLANVRSN